MEELNREILLIKLALHVYDEEVQRNESLDNRNKSIVAFLGVMLTIQCTILPRLIQFKVILSSFEIFVLFSIFIISSLFYFVSLLIFISTLKNLDNIQTAPGIGGLIEFELNNNSFKYIVQNTLISLNHCIEDNDEILKVKNVKGNLGLRLLKFGVIFTVIFIIYVILIFI